MIEAVIVLVILAGVALYIFKRSRKFKANPPTNPPPLNPPVDPNEDPRTR
jgi:hypothetical protein